MADDAAGQLKDDAAQVLDAALAALEPLATWQAAGDRGRPADRAGRRAGAQAAKAFAPVRMAVTGQRISPPLFESMEMLGRERSLGRLRAGFERAGAVG